MPRPTVWVDLNCHECGNPFRILRWQYRQKTIRRTKKPFCSATCKNKFQKLGGKNSGTWSGGRYVCPSNGGYVYINISPNKRILEHRYIMERFLGRKLKKSEVVHHINGNVSDNKVNNLVVCKSPGEHRAKYHNKDGSLKG